MQASLLSEESLFEKLADADTFELATRYQIPGYVKEALARDDRDPSELPSTAYADDYNRRFRCDSGPQALLALAGFLEKKAEYSAPHARKIEERLQSAIRIHGVAKLASEVRVRHTTLSKDAFAELPDDQFAYVFETDNPQTRLRKLPLRNAQEIKTAAVWLEDYRDDFFFSDRHTMAHKILKRAVDLSVPVASLPESLQKQAGQGLGSPSAVHDLLSQRIRLAQEQPLREKLAELRDAIATSPQILTDSRAIQAVNVLEQLDRELGIKYSSATPRPEDVFFSIPLTKAAAVIEDNMELTNGHIYPKEALARVPIADIEAVLGRDIVGDMSTGLEIDPIKAAQVARFLPLDDADIISRLLDANGIEPLFKAAGDSRAIPLEELVKLASHLG